jgi:hypothetical protein
MSWIVRLYRKYINGIIFTLVFHIILFSTLLFSEVKTKIEIKETEILIDFPEPEKEKTQFASKQELIEENTAFSENKLTNTASNKASDKQSNNSDDEFQKELDQAKNLVKDVSRQLSKEIPTVGDLQMPEETTDEKDFESFKDKGYTGDSNVEYFLENRFHRRLPIPVYLAEGGGWVKVNIVVDRSGKVTKAEPVIEPHLNEQILSYAKTAALRTRFNSSDRAPTNQAGYIKYHFIAQK